MFLFLNYQLHTLSCIFYKKKLLPNKTKLILINNIPRITLKTLIAVIIPNVFLGILPPNSLNIPMKLGTTICISIYSIIINAIKTIIGYIKAFFISLLNLYLFS